MLELTYYPARGTCDAIRLILSEVGVSYQENLINGIDFSDVEDGIEFGCLPLLQEDDFRLVGPVAILKYIACRYGLCGSTIREQAQCDMWVEACFDTLHEFWNSDFMKRDNKYSNDPLRLRFVDSYLVPRLSKFCQMLSVRNGPFLVGTKFSCADIVLFSLLDALLRELEVVVMSFAPLKDFHEQVRERPRIKHFYNSPHRY